MSYKSNLKNIKAFVFDVDGVFTDGSVYLMPDGSMSRTMNVLDGYAVVKARKHNYPICVITGGDDPMVRNRINYLGITDYYAKIGDKLEKFEEFKLKYNLKNLFRLQCQYPLIQCRCYLLYQLRQFLQNYVDQ